MMGKQQASRTSKLSPRVSSKKKTTRSFSIFFDDDTFFFYSKLRYLPAVQAKQIWKNWDQFLFRHIVFVQVYCFLPSGERRKQTF